MYLIFYCPECKHTAAVPEEQIKPGPVYCGPCHTERKRKVQVYRDYTAEGVQPGCQKGSPKQA